jgi:hypothetical protein
VRECCIWSFHELHACVDVGEVSFKLQGYCTTALNLVIGIAQRMAAGQQLLGSNGPQEGSSDMLILEIVAVSIFPALFLCLDSLLNNTLSVLL